MTADLTEMLCSMTNEGTLLCVFVIHYLIEESRQPLIEVRSVFFNVLEKLK